MWYTWKILFFAYFLCAQARTIINDTYDKRDICHLPTSLIEEINSYRDNILRIVKTVTTGRFKHKAWDELAHFVDTYNPRYVDNLALKESIRYIYNNSKELFFDVHNETIRFNSWRRGPESAKLMYPLKRRLAVLGLVGSAATKKEGLLANVTVVNNLTDLKYRRTEVAGKIVVLNEIFKGYNETENIIKKAVQMVTKFKGIAVLVRSMTPFSLYTPHTGRIVYENPFNPIPVAFITVEDAVSLRRLQDKGKRLELKLRLDVEHVGPIQSLNTIVEYPGNVTPSKTFIMSGHIDAMDIGEGAMEGSGGVMIPWNALKLLQHVNFTIKRTIRMVLYSASEFDHAGAHNYVRRHLEENSKIQFVLESDIGAFLPAGVAVGDTDKTITECIIQTILKLLISVMSYDLKLMDPLMISNPPSDITFWQLGNVPCGRLVTLSKDYPIYRNSNADSMLAITSKALDMNIAIYAAMSYVLADLSYDLPR